jgi:hypothetical protein
MTVGFCKCVFGFLSGFSLGFVGFLTGFKFFCWLFSGFGFFQGSNALVDEKRNPHLNPVLYGSGVDSIHK